MVAFAAKLLNVGLSKLSPKIRDWVIRLLTQLMDFLEKHFNNIVKHIFPIGGAGLGLGLLANVSDSIIDGATQKFGFFSRLLQVDDIFISVDNILTPYMTNWNCGFLQAFSSFGGIDAINTIINSVAYALVFWLCVTAFKWVISVLPQLLVLLAPK